MTSENPSDREHPKPNTGPESKEQVSGSKIKIPSTPAEPQAEPAKHHCEVTTHTKRDWIDWGTLIFEGVGLSVLVVYTIATIVYACITHSMWKEMQEQTRIQRDLYANTQRPRLGIDDRARITKPIIISGENGHRQAQIQTVVYIKNFGTQPALHVGYDQAVLVPPITVKDYQSYSRSEANATCNMADASTTNKKGPYIFPNNTHFEVINMPLQEPGKDGFTWAFRMVGCISYWDETQKLMHHTRFCFKPGLDDPNGSIAKITPNSILYACEDNEYTD